MFTLQISITFNNLLINQINVDLYVLNKYDNKRFVYTFYTSLLWYNSNNLNSVNHEVETRFIIIRYFIDLFLFYH